MSKKYWEIKPEELGEEDLKKYICDWFVNQVQNHYWGNIHREDQLQEMRADVTQLNYALLLLATKYPMVDNLDE